MWPRLVNVVLGIWLMAAPAVLGYSTSATVAAASDRILGPLVVSTAMVAIWPQVRGARNANVVFGGLAVLAPLLIGPFVVWPVAAAVNSVVSGLVIAVLARAGGRVERRYGGGWRSVWHSEIDMVSGEG